MLKCKIASESPCGKDCCCFVCEDKNTCKDVCTEISRVDFESPILSCEEVIHDADELSVFEKNSFAVMRAIAVIASEKKKLEEQDKKMRDELKAAMEQYGVKSFENDFLKITYVAPTERKSIDSTKLKKEHPEIAEAYQKVSQVKASVKIEVK